jgi:hypothetical protein
MGHTEAVAQCEDTAGGVGVQAIELEWGQRWSWWWNRDGACDGLALASKVELGIKELWRDSSIMR